MIGKHHFAAGELLRVHARWCDCFSRNRIASKATIIFHAVLSGRAPNSKLDGLVDAVIMAIFTPMTSRPNRASPTSFQFANSDEFLFAGGPASQPPKRTAWACVRTGSAAMEWVNARYQCSRRTWRRDRVDGRALSCHRCNSRLQSQAGSQRPRTWARSTATFGSSLGEFGVQGDLRRASDGLVQRSQRALSTSWTSRDPSGYGLLRVPAYRPRPLCRRNSRRSGGSHRHPPIGRWTPQPLGAWYSAGGPRAWKSCCLACSGISELPLRRARPRGALAVAEHR